MPIDPAIRAGLSVLEGTTLHRLLGSNPGNRTRFRHDRLNRLPHDVVVVDETSMVSLSMMARVAEAVRSDARLILVGDPEQLARLELVQETGLSARRFTPLGFLYSAHGLSSQGFHAFLATGLTAGTPQREAEEQDMQHEWVSRAQFRAMIQDGAITDDSSVAAFALLLLHENSREC